jgi:prevent-host-death family protein
MQTISVREANQNFSKYLSLVEAGQEFVIAKRGKPVALLMPQGATAASELSHEEKLAQAQQWLAKFSFEGVHGPFAEDDMYD